MKKEPSIAAPRWLMKTEPSVFSLDDLRREGRTLWTGVRNYQARNLMRDQMCVGDQVFIYHSNAQPPGVAGVGRVTRTGIADPTQFDPGSPYYDPRARPDSPVWVLVEVGFVAAFPRLLSLDEIKADPAFADLPLLRKGNRLSIQPVPPAEAERLLRRLAPNPL